MRRAGPIAHAQPVLRCCGALGALLALLACDGASAPRPATPSPVTPDSVAPGSVAPGSVGPSGGASSSLSPGSEAEQLYHRARVRDPEPSCAALEAGLASPVEALLAVSEVEAPPVTSIRAARCLALGHAAEVEPQLLRWVHARETMGLGLVVLGSLDRLPPELAARLATAALAGEYPDLARRRIARVRPALLEASSAAVEPGTVEPGTVEPGTVEPGTVEPGPTRTAP